MPSAELPDNGPARLGPVDLPAGRRVLASEGPGGEALGAESLGTENTGTENTAQPLAWVTSVDVPEPGPVWAQLSGLRGQTGLVPVLLDGEADEEDYFFFRRADIAEIDGLDGATVLAAWWEANQEDPSESGATWDTPLSRQFLGLDTPPPEGHGLGDIAGAVLRVMMDPSANAELSQLSELDRRNALPLPFQPREPEPDDKAGPFRGLAPPADGGLSRAEREGALASLPPARIGLVPAARPADVPALVGWVTFGVDPYCFGPVQVSANGVWVAAVLRSFEDRFGATLLSLGPGADMQLLVERPPRTLEHATRVAAEHSVFADECAGRGLGRISEIAAAIVGAPIWTFWWD
jgi:Domain of unknown function (DUF4253)